MIGYLTKVNAQWGGIGRHLGVHRGTQGTQGYTGYTRVHRGCYGYTSVICTHILLKCTSLVLEVLHLSIMLLVIFSVCTVMYSILYTLRMHCRIASG